MDNLGILYSSMLLIMKHNYWLEKNKYIFIVLGMKKFCPS